MTEHEAIQKAREFLLQTTGKDAEPETARFVDCPGSPACWFVIFSPRVFFAKELDQGSTLDGGEYVLNVDDVSGKVCVFG